MTDEGVYTQPEGLLYTHWASECLGVPGSLLLLSGRLLIQFVHLRRGAAKRLWHGGSQQNGGDGGDDGVGEKGGGRTQRGEAPGETLGDYKGGGPVDSHHHGGGLASHLAGHALPDEHPGYGAPGHGEAQHIHHQGRHGHKVQTGSKKYRVTGG